MITLVAIVLSLVGVALVFDVARVWRLEPSEFGGAERVQLRTGIALIVFVGAFLVGRGGTEEQPEAAALATTPVAESEADTAALTALRSSARLPSLREAEEPQPPRDRRRREGSREPAEEPARPPEPEALTTPTTTTTTPTTTTPAPEPAPEPAPPPPEDLPFDSRE